MENIKREDIKRELSLDFTKPRHRGHVTPSLCTPNITPLLDLSTPELNKMIVATGGGELTVLTPNGISSVISQANILPSPLIPTTVNNSNNNNSNLASNNGSNGNGFITLTTTKNNNNNNSANNNVITNANNNTINSNNNNNRNQTAHSRRCTDKSIRDLDLEKIEKKRERNRLAAKKCRQRKLETIDELRKKVSELELKYERKVAENEHLQMELERFKNLRNKELEQSMQVHEYKPLLR